jgi:2-methylaconitate cis-trans-isomerase PrpF
MGSPDAQFGLQLNGMGSGLSSTSKIVILGPPSRDDVDVDFTFVQVGIRDGVLDMAGNCGNMSSIVGPAAWDHGLVRGGYAEGLETDADGTQWATVRVFNTNTSKVIVSRFKVAGSPARYCSWGDYVMDGVPGTNSLISLSFMDPAGAKTGRALPTGNPVDELELPDGSTVRASLVDVGNPGVFVSTRSVGLDEATAAGLSPAAIEGDEELKKRLEQIRRAGTAKMGLDPNVESVPKIVLLFPGEDTPDGADIRCAAMSMGQAHKAVPLTLALCLGAAARIPGTLAADLVAARDGGREGVVTIAHPSGKLDVGTEMRDGRILSAKLLRTARVMMKGDVYY